MPRGRRKQNQIITPDIRSSLDVQHVGSDMTQPAIPPERKKIIDAHFQAQLEAARNKYGAANVYVGSYSDNLIIGIPMPSLPMEYLFGQSVFPLSFIIQLAGLPGSLKSSLLYEFFRWFRDAGGGSYLFETENKLSDHLESIVGHPSNVVVMRCDSLEDWQAKLQHAVIEEEQIAKGTPAAPGPGLTYPVCFAVDSIMGKLSNEIQERVQNDGYMSKAHPIEALSLAGYFRSIPRLFAGKPYALVLTNHMKLSKDESFREVRRVAGGYGVSFHESFEFDMRVTKPVIRCRDWEGVQIRIKTVKNSFGPSQREIKARMLWKYITDPVDNKLKQCIWWDWDWSLVALLADIKRDNPKQLSGNNFHLEVPSVSEIENSAWSRNIGMSEKDAAQWSVVGAMLHKSPEVRELLRRILGIRIRPVLKGCFIEQQNALITNMI